ncbi:AMP-binding protein [Corynebacterium pilosum]|uniref:Acetyl-coenzyme A synthetase n=1 Tax=Corynebacterium pilosum TaxID=35756 RepID=A0A376CNL6_9CORY|nr:AMP-binding protein [Corynebacterium pilosum]STC69807.1 acetyl-coenzyme A synthetase [Corynebacterium pilosum]
MSTQSSGITYDLPTANTTKFQEARQFLVEHSDDYDTAKAEFEWPRFDTFNWALEWFDYLGASPESRDREALVISEVDGTRTSRTFAEMSRRSAQLANWLESIGVQRGQRVMLMLNNQVELWESMLACIKGGFVLNPATAMLGEEDLQDRTSRAEISWVIANSEDAAKFDGVTGDFTVIQIDEHGTPAQSAHPTQYYSDSFDADEVYVAKQETQADETLLMYFTSGTTSRAKLVVHTHTSYPVGHLTTMYWIGLNADDVHLNVAAPGWAKHAWSNFFAPWIAWATIFVYNYSRFVATDLMDNMEREGVTSFCAPPTVWRMLARADLDHIKTPPTKILSAGEPLNPEMIALVEKHWGTTVRDGYGQTELTLAIANTPGQEVKPGAVGRALPGQNIVLIDPVTEQPAAEGEICLKLDNNPVGLTPGYYREDEKNAETFRDGLYHTGDIASMDEEGYITYVGRNDDVFKASDYRLSPFELESAVIEHPHVAEVAVVPSPDPVRLAVPKAYVALVAGVEPSDEVAEDILRHCRNALAPYKRIRRLEFYELPKTISGKIRRVDLRKREQEIHAADEGATKAENEYADTDFPSLKG